MLYSHSFACNWSECSAGFSSDLEFVKLHLKSSVVVILFPEIIGARSILYLKSESIVLNVMHFIFIILKNVK